MWLMLQQDTAEDYVIATGETHSVKELLEFAFSCVRLKWEDYVVVDDKFYRPTEIYELRGDSTKARRKLGWKPTVSFEDLIQMMVEEDMKSLKYQISSTQFDALNKKTLTR